MSGAAAPAELAVRRLRVVDRGGDALRARLAAERLLSVARPRPRGLAPGAVLIVRSLALRAPGDCAAALARWRVAAEEALEVRLRAAARPASEPVPADAPAVLFADRAELLACLADDLAAGMVGARWWWRAELGFGVGAATVAARWEACAADAPAALELLAARGRAVEALRAFPAGAAERVLVAVAAAHGVTLPAGWPAVAGAPPPGNGVRVRRASRGATAAGSPRAAAAVPAPLAPWDADAPEASAPALAPAQRALLGIALTLRRRRPLVRATAFTPALARWWADASAAPAAPVERSVAAPAVLPVVRPGPAPLAAPRTDAAPKPRPTGHGETIAPTTLPPALGDHLNAAPPDAPGTAAAAPSSAAAQLPPPATHLGPPAATVTRARRLAADNFAPAVPTALGGLFLLVNLGLYLNLYGDFTQPRAPGIALDPWDFAALLGRELLPAARRGRLARDPAWRLLAELAGREPVDAPGAGFHPPRAWRIPHAWLAPFDDARAAWRWSAADGRLRVLHPAGFLALDVAARGEPSAQLARELARLGAPPPQLAREGEVPARPAAAVAPPALARWVGWLAPYAAARLRAALGARTPAAAARTALLLPARVAISPGRVDLTIPLAALPLALRRAGLDRTPGWIPAAGRHVAVHFDA